MTFEPLQPLDLPATTATLAVTPSPSPGQQEELDATTVTPGLLGFLVTFAVVLACIPLFRSMTTKLRGVERRAMDETDDVSPRPLPAEPPTPGDGGGESR